VALATGGAIGRTHASPKSSGDRLPDSVLGMLSNPRIGAGRFLEVCNSLHSRPIHCPKGVRTRHDGSRSHRTHRRRTENSLVEQLQIIAENHEPKSPHNLTPNTNFGPASLPKGIGRTPASNAPDNLNYKCLIAHPRTLAQASTRAHIYPGQASDSPSSPSTAKNSANGSPATTAAHHGHEQLRKRPLLELG
jgi:hypothetical protein